MDPIYGRWPRAAYSCGPTGDGKGHNRGNYPYQELVFGCASSPPIVEGRPLWQALPLTLPDLNDPRWREPLRLENFVFPYTRMDIPTPQPFHVDQTAQPDPSVRQRVLGAPRLAVSKTTLKVGFAPGSGSTTDTFEIQNTGTGILAWYAVSPEPWVIIKPYAGAALGPDLPCDPNAPCARTARLEVSVDATRAPTGKRTVPIRVRVLGTPQETVVNVEVSIIVRIGAPGVTKN
jgi:hypothetical protein